MVQDQPQDSSNCFMRLVGPAFPLKPAFSFGTAASIVKERLLFDKTLSCCHRIECKRLIALALMNSSPSNETEAFIGGYESYRICWPFVPNKTIGWPAESSGLALSTDPLEMRNSLSNSRAGFSD
jgi:hypothetical protein